MSAIVAACDPAASPRVEVAGASSGAIAADGGSDASSAAPRDGGADGAAAASKRLFVREALVDCEGEGPMKCMQVRESETDDWSLFYGSIEGFTYEPSHAYELRVASQASPRPPAGGSSVRYRLVEIVSKKKVPAAGK